jgi:predicted phosphodiesterase
MKITTELFNQAIMLDREFRKRGEKLSRNTLSDALKIPIQQARYLLFAIQNIDILQFKKPVIECDADFSALVISDLHIPYQDNIAVELALSYGESKKVSTIILLGDIIDFYQISTFLHNPKKQSVFEEINLTRIFLQDLRKRFPNARIIFKRGNHEDRLDKYIIRNAPEIHSLIDNLLPNVLKLQDLNIEHIIDPFQLGYLWLLHGHEFRCTGNAEWICNLAFNQIHDHFIMGHWHRKQDKIFPHITQDKKWSGNAIGWLGSPVAAEDYARLNKWNNGFAIIDFNKKGQFKVDNKVILNGEIY